MFHSYTVNFDLNYILSKETLVKIIYQIKQKKSVGIQQTTHQYKYFLKKQKKNIFKDQYRRFNLKIKHKML